MAIKSIVEKEICELTNAKKRSLNLRQWHFKLVKAVDLLEEEDYHCLSNDTKKWVSEAMEAIENAEEIPLFPDHATLVKQRKDASSNSIKHRNKNLANKNKSASQRSQEIMLENNINITAREVYIILMKEDYQYSFQTLKVIMAEFRRTLKFLWNEGLLTKKPNGL